MSRQARSSIPSLFAALALCTASLRPQEAVAAPVTEESEPANAGAPGPDTEESESLEALRQQAIDRFQAKDYEGAVDYFKRAYAVDPNPNYLFNIGRVYEEAGELEESVTYYERFIQERGVDLESRGLALDRLQILRALIAETTRISEPETAEPEPEPEPESELPAPPEVTDPEADKRAPKKGRGLRIAGYTLLGVGAAALIGGGAFGGLALSQSKALGDTDGFDPRHDLIDSGEKNTKFADALFITGGALALTGLALVLGSLRGSRAAKAEAIARRRSVAPLVGHKHVGMALSGRF